MKRVILLTFFAGLASSMGSVSQVAAQPRPLLKKVEHFYLVSDESRQLFQFFKDEFGLPVVWPFSDYGTFASGGLSLGNVVMEFGTEKVPGGAAHPAEFKGIAFEPVGDAAAAVAELNRRRIPHGEPEPYEYTRNGEKQVGWVTVELKGLPPTNTEIFICDYKQRQLVTAGRNRANGELIRRGGGPMGVTSLKEIVIAVKSLEEAEREWARLTDTPGRWTSAIFAFGKGPSIRLVRAEAEGIQGIVVQVKSLARAKQFLIEKRMLGRASKGRLQIAPAALGGLVIDLVED